jgi:hypothetical protein
MSAIYYIPLPYQFNLEFKTLPEAIKQPSLGFFSSG